MIRKSDNITHAHKRSLIACGIYISGASMLMDDMDLSTAVEMGIYNAIEYYKDMMSLMMNYVIMIG
ncbi:MAG: ADP-ribosyl-[dinitrogen reductase] hydrolase [Clostridium sp.]